VAVAIAVRARYFARLRELAGVEVEVVQMSGGSTLGDAYKAAREKHPALPEQQGVRGAVNHEFAGWDTKIANGDEVAFIPPVSGGGFPCATT
jgi:molybdopterin converting factor subunit 1